MVKGMSLRGIMGIFVAVGIAGSGGGLPIRPDAVHGLMSTAFGGRCMAKEQQMLLCWVAVRCEWLLAGDVDAACWLRADILAPKR